MPKIVDHDQYREELLSRYFDLFARRGYLDVTMREISRELGVSTGTLYHYFPTKKALLEALFKMASRRDALAVLSQFSEQTPINERLKAFVDYVKNNETYFQDIVLLTVDYYRFEDSKEFFETMREADSHYGQAFIRGLRLKPELALLAEVFLNGLVYHRLVFPDSVPFDALAEQFQKIMLHYIQTGGEKTAD